MTPKNWSLSVVASEASALPKASWTPPEELEDLFGFKRAYYNPYHWSKHARITENIGFYGVVMPFPECPVCETSKECIRMVLLLPLLPIEAQAVFQKEGIDGLINLAEKVYHFTPTQSIAA